MQSFSHHLVLLLMVAQKDEGKGEGGEFVYMVLGRKKNHSTKRVCVCVCINIYLILKYNIKDRCTF